MKILFSVLHPGHMHFFNVTLEILVSQGHSLELVFHANKRNLFIFDDFSIERRLGTLAGHPNVRFFTRAPQRRDRWSPFLDYIRALSDYSLYFRPEYQHVTSLRRRAAAKIKNEQGRRTVEWLAKVPGALLVLDYFLPLLERMTPPDPKIVEFIRSKEPDMLLVTPFVQFRSKQVDYVKAARFLGIPTGLCVASWDNLTNKGRMGEIPDRNLCLERSATA